MISRQASPSNSEPLAMASLRRVARPGSLVVILSDFIGISRAAQSYLSSVARHNEVLAVVLSDPLERELPPPGRYRLVSDGDELAIVDLDIEPVERGDFAGDGAVDLADARGGEDPAHVPIAHRWRSAGQGSECPRSRSSAPP